MTAYAEGALRRFGELALQALGASAEEAQVLTDCLIDAELRTAPYQHQGLVRLAVYGRRLRDGGLTPRAAVTVVSESESTALLDGGGGLGQVVAHRAMTLAIAKARATGIGAVAARCSNHFGTASYFTLMAARSGLIGLAFTNASPELPAWGGAEALVGTNPWSIAVPHPGREPVVLDISNAASGKGAIRHYAAEGRTLPPDWALDRSGRPVIDAREAADALLAPMGGYKGYGIAVMVDLLTGGLAGGAVGAAVGSPYAFARQQGVSHLTMALDPERFGGGAALDRAVEQVDREIHGSPRQPGVDAVYLPGDPEWLRAAARRDGIALARDTEEQLRALSAETGVPFPVAQR